MDSGLSGMTTWITGASGGIGRALAEAFAEEGSNLLLHAGTQLDALRDFVSTRPWRDRALCVAADVRDPDALERNVDQGIDKLGRVDVCVANAGIWPPDARGLHEMPVERLREVIEINLLGALYSARAFLRGLSRVGAREDGRGASLCFIGSTAGRFGEAFHVEYAASKAALRGVVRSLKNEMVRLDPWGRVNMVEPGWTTTPMAETSLGQADAVRAVLETTPLRQLSRPEDIAKAVVWLCGPGLSRNVTGEILTVAGGMEGRVQWAREQVDPAAVWARMREP